MAITTSRLTPALGAIVEGVTLADDLPPEAIGRLGELLVEHQILFFRGQPITPQQQVRFAANFGELHIHPIYPVLPELPQILVLDTHGDFLPDNDNWHTDVTFIETPPLGAALYAKKIPPAGGMTTTFWAILVTLLPNSTPAMPCMVKRPKYASPSPDTCVTCTPPNWSQWV